MDEKNMKPTEKGKPQVPPNTAETTYVGSTKVYAEIGCRDGVFAYATVSADNNIDATIVMNVYYNNDKEYTTVTGGCEQRTYGEVGYKCSSRISRVEGFFTISSEDDGRTLDPLTLDVPN
ncbi:MAG: hypothetical protein NC251_06355 [Lachnoclostridium sp.]|nr:hypothetical protein [Lachnospira sp.]MCM1248036.1 hypothetical protein [Lachnoclostridium sp.]MCM1535853.1 hypothetical protein [Clostridium sp.]